MTTSTYCSESKYLFSVSTAGPATFKKQLCWFGLLKWGLKKTSAESCLVPAIHGDFRLKVENNSLNYSLIFMENKRWRLEIFAYKYSNLSIECSAFKTQNINVGYCLLAQFAHEHEHGHRHGRITPLSWLWKIDSKVLMAYITVKTMFFC